MIGLLDSSQPGCGVAERLPAAPDLNASACLHPSELMPTPLGFDAGAEPPPFRMVCHLGTSPHEGHTTSLRPCPLPLPQLRAASSGPAETRWGPQWGWLTRQPASPGQHHWGPLALPTGPKGWQDLSSSICSRPPWLGAGVSRQGPSVSQGSGHTQAAGGREDRDSSWTAGHQASSTTL